MAHEVDLLLSCGCIKLERIEAAIYLPNRNDDRVCAKHNRAVKVYKVGNPYHVNDEPEENRIAGRYVNK